VHHLQHQHCQSLQEAHFLLKHHYLANHRSGLVSTYSTRTNYQRQHCGSKPVLACCAVAATICGTAAAQLGLAQIKFANWL
jgi:hypothetical protein